MRNADDESVTTEYTYSLTGNKATTINGSGSQSFTYNDSNQLTQMSDAEGTVSYTYDDRGNRISESRGLNDTKTYSYDIMNRLISVTDYDGTVITYSYDGLGNRISETITSSGVTTNLTYVNDYTQDVVEVLTKTTGTVEENYYYGNNRISSDDTIYGYDGLSNVNMTLSLTGSIQNKYEYSDYGERSLDSKTEIINNEFGYNGEAHTADGLQYLRARYYDPVIGVFISADSYRGEVNDLLSQNRYTYAHNNPYKYDDPTGHAPIAGINKNNAVMLDGTTPTVVNKKKKEEETSSSGNSKPKASSSPDTNPTSSQVYMHEQESKTTAVQKYDLNASKKEEQTYAVPSMQENLTENKNVNFSEAPTALDETSNQKVPVKIVEDEDVIGKAETSDVGVEMSIETGEISDESNYSLFERVEKIISSVFGVGTSSKSKEADEAFDLILNAIDRMSEGRAVHSYIEIEIAKYLLKTGVTVHRDRTIGGISGKGDSRLRPDLVIQEGKASYIYEIKPDSKYGNLTGPVQLMKYQAEFTARNQNAVIGSHYGVESWVANNATITVNGKSYNLTLQNGLILYNKVTDTNPLNPEDNPVPVIGDIPQEQDDKKSMPSVQLDKDLVYAISLSAAMGLTIGVLGQGTLANNELRMR